MFTPRYAVRAQGSTGVDLGIQCSRHFFLFRAVYEMSRLNDLAAKLDYSDTYYVQDDAA